MGVKKQYPSDYDPNNQKKRYDIPKLESRARSQGAGKFVPGLTENAVEHKIADNKGAAQHKKYLAANSSRSVRTSNTGGNNIKRTGLSNDRSINVGDLRLINEREKGLKQAYSSMLTAKVKKAKKRK